MSAWCTGYLERSGSLPTRERGLKSSGRKIAGNWYESLPTRERGLKFDGFGDMVRGFLSLPTRERGLKS